MKKKIVSILIVIVWMVLIFYMSSCDGSTSSSQSNFIVDIIINIFNIKNVDNISFIIRKIAHFSEYFVLGLLLCNMFNYLKKNMLYSIIIGMLYAISDEVHQSFVPGRCCSIFDMCIDTLGVICGTYIYLYIYRKYFKYKREVNCEKRNFV